MRRRLGAWALAAAVLTLSPTSAQPFSGGPLRNVTDLTPTCASCHSSFNREQLRELPEAVATSLIPDTRHYKAIEDGTGPYQSMSPADRQRLLADVKTMDQNASVTISVPQALKPGQEGQISAAVKGGHGLVGVLLVDTDLRYQARPIQADGWLIVGPPRIWGGDGKEQTRWVDSRAPGLKKNLNSAIVFDQVSDIAAKKLAEAKVVWTVKAPQEPGNYSVTVAFQFGTEKASPVGTVTTPTGAVLPRGGPGGPSSRIMFAKPIHVAVR